MSTLVKMPSGCMPANRASPDTPDPVPISTTALAPTALARKVSGGAAPTERGHAQWRGVGARRGGVVGLGTKFSAYAHDAALGAALAEVLAGAVTGSA